MNLSKKLAYALIVVVILLGLAFIWQKYSNKKQSKEFFGKVTKVNDNAINADGFIDFGNNKNEKASITFTITPQTKFVNNVAVLHKTPTESDKNGYTPEVRVVDGKFSDISTKTALKLVKSDKNLVGVNKAIAIEVDYETYIFE